MVLRAGAVTDFAAAGEEGGEGFVGLHRAGFAAPEDAYSGEACSHASRLSGVSSNV
jgi:hypothetical protein